MIRGLLSILLLSRGLLMKSLAFLLLFSFLAVSSFAAPQSAAPEGTSPSSAPTDERLDRILRSLEALRQTSEKQTKQTLTSMEEAKIRIDTITDRNIGWVNMGYAALAVFAALFALAGVGITYFTTQTYREQVKGKKEAFEKYEKEKISWMNGQYKCNPSHPENLIHNTMQGHLVRSKSEVIIANTLYMNQIPYRYENQLEVKGVILYPDFTILHPKTNNLCYWEHFGMMENETYRENAYNKLKLYGQNGIIPSINLITTFETKSHPIDSGKIQQIVKEKFVL